MTHSPVVLGLDFGGTKIAIAVCDLSGNRVGETVLATQAAAGAASATPLWIQPVHEPRTDDKTGDHRHARQRRKMRASARN